MHTFVQRVSRSAVSWSLIATTLRFGSALLILPLMLRRISPTELGLWYVFVSLGTFALILDLGFAHTVVRATGYLWAGSRVLLPFGINVQESSTSARRPNLPMLADLVATLRFYYLAAGSALLLLLSVIGGAWIWHKSAGLTNATSIRFAFLAYAFGLSLGLANNLWPSLLSGVNAVRVAQQIAASSLLGYLCFVVAGLLLGWGIWALVLGVAFTGVVERLVSRAIFFRRTKLPPGKFDFSIIALLWPNAWRTAAVGLGAFLVLQANTLVCSAFLDLRATASYGLSLQAVTLLASVSSVWVLVKMPAINHLRAQHFIENIAEIFRPRLLFALFTFILGAVVLLSLGQQLLLFLRAQTTLLPTALLALLLVVQFLEMHHALYGELVYSENVNPFVRPALISGSAIVCLSIILTPRFGLWGMLGATAGVQLCFNNWWPVVRAIRGLGPAGRHYWRDFFIFARRSNARASDR